MQKLPGIPGRTKNREHSRQKGGRLIRIAIRIVVVLVTGYVLWEINTPEYNPIHDSVAGIQAGFNLLLSGITVLVGVLLLILTFLGSKNGSKRNQSDYLPEGWRYQPEQTSARLNSARRRD
jgi:hypothetical protein